MSTVLEPSWDDNPTWEGSKLYANVAAAQQAAADAYVQEMYDGDDEHGELVWAPAGEGWVLTDGGAPTPVSIGIRPVHGGGEVPAELAAARQRLSLASEFRVPIPDLGFGGYGEVVVQRQPDGCGDRWAVTDGANTGLRAWVKDEGWRYVTDIGRAAVFLHSLDEALLLAQWVAGTEAAAQRVRLAAARPHDGTPGVDS